MSASSPVFVPCGIQHPPTGHGTANPSRTSASTTTTASAGGGAAASCDYGFAFTHSALQIALMVLVSGGIQRTSRMVEELAGVGVAPSAINIPQQVQHPECVAQEHPFRNGNTDRGAYQEEPYHRGGSCSTDPRPTQVRDAGQYFQPIHFYSQFYGGPAPWSEAAAPTTSQKKRPSAAAVSRDENEIPQQGVLIPARTERDKKAPMTGAQHQHVEHDEQHKDERIPHEQELVKELLERLLRCVPDPKTAANVLFEHLLRGKVTYDEQLQEETLARLEEKSSRRNEAERSARQPQDEPTGNRPFLAFSQQEFHAEHEPVASTSSATTAEVSAGPSSTSARPTKLNPNAAAFVPPTVISHPDGPEYSFSPGGSRITKSQKVECYDPGKRMESGSSPSQMSIEAITFGPISRTRAAASTSSRSSGGHVTALGGPIFQQKTTAAESFTVPTTAKSVITSWTPSEDSKQEKREAGGDITVVHCATAKELDQAAAATLRREVVNAQTNPEQQPQHRPACGGRFGSCPAAPVVHEEFGGQGGSFVPSPPPCGKSYGSLLCTSASPFSPPCSPPPMSPNLDYGRCGNGAFVPAGGPAAPRGTSSWKTTATAVYDSPHTVPASPASLSSMAPGIMVDVENTAKGFLAPVVPPPMPPQEPPRGASLFSTPSRTPAAASETSATGAGGPSPDAMLHHQQRSSLHNRDSIQMQHTQQQQQQRQFLRQHLSRTQAVDVVAAQGGPCDKLRTSAVSLASNPQPPGTWLAHDSSIAAAVARQLRLSVQQSKEQLSQQVQESSPNEDHYYPQERCRSPQLLQPQQPAQTRVYATQTRLAGTTTAAAEATRFPQTGHHHQSVPLFHSSAMTGGALSSRRFRSTTWGEGDKELTLLQNIRIGVPGTPQNPPPSHSPERTASCTPVVGLHTPGFLFPRDGFSATPATAIVGQDGNTTTAAPAMSSGADDHIEGPRATAQRRLPDRAVVHISSHTELDPQFRVPVYQLEVMNVERYLSWVRNDWRAVLLGGVELMDFVLLWFVGEEVEIPDMIPQYEKKYRRKMVNLIRGVAPDQVDPYNALAGAVGGREWMPALPRRFQEENAELLARLWSRFELTKEYYDARNGTATMTSSASCTTATAGGTSPAGESRFLGRGASSSGIDSSGGVLASSTSPAASASRPARRTSWYEDSFQGGEDIQEHEDQLQGPSAGGASSFHSWSFNLKTTTAGAASAEQIDSTRPRTGIKPAPVTAGPVLAAKSSASSSSCTTTTAAAPERCVLRSERTEPAERRRPAPSPSMNNLSEEEEENERQRWLPILVKRKIHEELTKIYLLHFPNQNGRGYLTNNRGKMNFAMKEQKKKQERQRSAPSSQQGDHFNDTAPHTPADYFLPEDQKLLALADLLDTINFQYYEGELLIQLRQLRWLLHVVLQGFEHRRLRMRAQPSVSEDTSSSYRGPNKQLARQLWEKKQWEIDQQEGRLWKRWESIDGRLRKMGGRYEGKGGGKGGYSWRPV
ncbi:unnamed protein product [Amoebophrya sp. A120]|nr:unnamed protein product [Amoebophrya sp. A120]|eukprot:GSA120T00024358001.1